MKKTILVLLLSLIGCNYGSSIADSQHSTSPSASGGSPGSGGASGSGAGGTTTPGVGGTTTVGSGGTTASASGGTSGAGSGGTTSVGAGGTTTTARGGSTGTRSGGTTGSGTGGTTTGAGGVTSAGGGSGGSTTGAGGTVAPDASATGGTGGGPDAPPADVRRNDASVPGTGGATVTGGTTGTGGATGAGGTTTACVPAASGGPAGMNTGQDCVSCHGSGQSPAMTAAGTLYASATGGSGVSGATVTITDSTGKKITMVTGSSGNFYTNTAISFPASIQVSKCPDTQTMPTTITKGGCNGSGCHTSSMRIHLP